MDKYKHSHMRRGFESYQLPVSFHIFRFTQKTSEVPRAIYSNNVIVWEILYSKIYEYHKIDICFSNIITLLSTVYYVEILQF